MSFRPKAQNIVHQFFKARLAPYGITPGQYGVLKCLWDEDGLTVKKLAERMYLDSSTITGLLDRMENKGLIKRQSSPSDRRALSVVLTPAGKALQEPVTQAIIDANQAVLKNMSEEEADSFLNILLSLNGK